MKRFMPIFLALIALAVMFGICFAETVKINGKQTEILKDAKGWYYLNDNGSKMRFTEIDAVRKGEPFMASLSAEDMSQKDVAKTEQDRQQAEVAKTQQEKERLIASKVAELKRAEAIQALKAEGKLDNNGNIIK